MIFGLLIFALGFLFLICWGIGFFFWLLSFLASEMKFLRTISRISASIFLLLPFILIGLMNLNEYSQERRTCGDYAMNHEIYGDIELSLKSDNTFILGIKQCDNAQFTGTWDYFISDDFSVVELYPRSDYLSQAHIIDDNIHFFNSIDINDCKIENVVLLRSGE